MRVLGVIPARGGSKSVPLKNIAIVGGRPLIAYTIDAARGARLLNRTIVSTDSQTIADVAMGLGAEVPFLRSAELAKDDTPAVATVIDAVKRVEEQEKAQYDYIVYLQPTSPFRRSDDIDIAISLALEKRADGVVSVVQAASHPQWTKVIEKDGRLKDYLPAGDRANRRQDLPPAYALNGAIYIARRDVLMEKATWYTERTFAYVMPPERSLDVDSPWDLYLADLALKAMSSAARK